VLVAEIATALDLYKKATVIFVRPAAFGSDTKQKKKNPAVWTDEEGLKITALTMRAKHLWRFSINTLKASTRFGARSLRATE
jgi:hypothetical protein